MTDLTTRIVMLVLGTALTIAIGYLSTCWPPPSGLVLGCMGGIAFLMFIGGFVGLAPLGSLLSLAFFLAVMVIVWAAVDLS